MSQLLERLTHSEEAVADHDRIALHYFYAAMVGYRDGVITRTQLENLFNINTTGADKTQLDWLLNKLDTAVDKERFLNAVHAVFMLSERIQKLTKQQAQDWLTIAAGPPV